MKENDSTNQDFKYVLHDLTNIYVGAKYTYNELVDLNDLPFRLRMAISNYLIHDLDGSMTLGEHVMKMKKGDNAYRVYRQIRAKFKLNIYDENLNGKGKPGYRQKEYKISDIVEGPESEELHAHPERIFVEEMHVTALGLLAL